MARSWVVWFGLAPVGAWGADVDHDGCVDEIATACVHPTATVHPSVTVGAGAAVGAGASVGAGKAIGAGAVIAPRAQVGGAGTLAGPQPVGAGSTIGRRSVVGVDGRFGDDDDIAADVAIGARLLAGDDVVVGFGADLGDDVTLGVGATIGNLVDVADGVQVGPGASIGRASQIGAGAQVDGDVGANVTIAAGAVVDAGGRVRSGASIGADAVVGPGGRVGRGSQVGAGAEVGSGAVVRAGGVVPGCSLLGTGDLVARGETWDGTETVAGCGGIVGTSETIDLPGGVVMEFVGIPAGSFVMGCVPGRDDVAETDCNGAWQYGQNPHDVTLTRDFWMAKFEVTTAQYNSLTPPSIYHAHFASCGPTCPRDNVNWHQAARFANRVSADEGLPSCYTCVGDDAYPTCTSVADPYACTGYRLPTEAEWEYAARAGTNFAYPGGDARPISNGGGENAILPTLGWWVFNSATVAVPTGTIHPVGQKLPNAFGVYDLFGNSWEWTNDWSDGTAHDLGPATDPTGAAYNATYGDYRIRKGGGYLDSARDSRLTARFDTWGPNRFSDHAFRLVRTAP